MDSDTAETVDTAIDDSETETVSKQIFISYEYDSIATAQLIHDRLTAVGCNAFLVEESMHGTALDDVAADIDKSGAVLLCITQKYRDNPNCRAHAEYAQGVEKPIIPLRLESDYELDSWLEPVCGDSSMYDFSAEEERDESLKSLASLLEDLGLVTASTDTSTNDEYAALFKMFDKDGSGTIEPAELGDALRYLGCNPTEREVLAMVEEADSKVNADGKLEFAEFCDFMEKNKKSADQEEDELRQAFKLFDKNGDGTIDRDELKKTIHSVGLWEGMSEQEIDEMLDAADTDHSGHIEYNELVRVLVSR